MNKINILTPLNLLLLLLMLAATVFGFATISADAMLPVHFDLFGQPDRLASRNEALAIMPAFAFGTLGLFLALDRFAPDKVAGARHIMGAILPLLLAMLLAFQVVMVMRIEFVMIQVITISMAALLVVLGNVLPKSQPNRVGGIRTRATLADPAIWAKTHRATGLFMMVTGCLLGLLALLTNYGPLLIAGLLLAVGLPVAFGALYSRALAAE